MNDSTKKKLTIVATICMTIGYACYTVGYAIILKKQIKEFRKASSPVK